MCSIGLTGCDGPWHMGVQVIAGLYNQQLQPAGVVISLSLHMDEMDRLPLKLINPLCMTQASYEQKPVAHLLGQSLTAVGRGAGWHDSVPLSAGYPGQTIEGP